MISGFLRVFSTHRDVCSCTDLHLLLKGKVSPRDTERFHQLNHDWLLAAVFRRLAPCSKQFLILVRNIGQHVAYLPVEAQHCLERMQQVSNSPLVYGSFCVCIFVAVFYSFCSVRTRRSWRSGWDQHLHPVGNRNTSQTHPHSFVFHRKPKIKCKECKSVTIRTGAFK